MNRKNFTQTDSARAVVCNSQTRHRTVTPTAVSYLTVHCIHVKLNTKMNSYMTGAVSLPTIA